MAAWKEGDLVRVVRRPVTEEDRRSNRYFEHMADLTGTVQNIYGEEEIAVKIDIPSLTAVSKDVHSVGIDRMREKFLGSVSEEQKKQLTPEELSFDAHYMLLIRSADLVKA